MAPNNLYINEVYIDTNSGNAYTGITNLLHGEDVHGDISTTQGFRWIAQIVNGSGSTINMANTTLRFQVCINHVSDENTADAQVDTNIDITSGTIASGASYYIGWTGLGATPNTASSIYLAAQKNGSNQIIAAPRFRLFLDGTALDVAGQNSKAGGGEFFSSSLLHLIFDSTSNGDGSLRRKESVTSPATTHTDSDWQISTTSHLLGSAAGDPHIKTLRGEHYEFDYLGAFRMFEYSKNGNFMLINGLAETGPGRWKNKQYIRKLFIQNNNANILLDMGFRGSPVKVLENNGITYTEKSLTFDAEAKRYNFDNTLSTLDVDAPITENLPGLVRNQLDIILDINNVGGNDIDNEELTFLSLQNVNEFNLQPCRLEIKMSNRLIDAAKGCLIDRKYAPVAKLDNINDITPLEEPTLEDLKHIPELEIAPRLRNIKWK